MKVIITGATGFVGGAVLKHCVADSRIDEIVVLSRRDLPEPLKGSSKVTVIILESFAAYTPEILKKLAGAQASLWALGLKGAPMGYADKTAAEEIDIAYPTAAARAFAEHLIPCLAKHQPFRFVLCSGIGAELDPNASCWWMGETRRLKGRAEKALLDIAEEHKGFEAYTCRPFGIRPEAPGWIESFVFKIMPSVEVVDLAAVMEDLGISGSDEWIWENAMIAKRGSELLR